MSTAPSNPSQARPIETATLVHNLSWRYAVKKFDPARKIPDATWSVLESAMVLAPSSYGFQPWKFIVVRDPGLRQKLRASAWNQPQVTDASHLVVFARRTDLAQKDVDRLVTRVKHVRNQSDEQVAGFAGMLSGFVAKPPPGFDASAWAARQTYIALGFFLSGCAMLGVDACPQEGFDPAQHDQILGLTGSGYASVVQACAGYRASDDMFASFAKVRFAASDVIDRR